MNIQDRQITREQLLKGLKVLVVEDDFFIAEEAREALENAGAEVLGPVGKFEEARDLLAETKPDCALLDINLGGGPDFASARAMAAQGVPVVFVTGYDCSVIPPELSHTACLQKPTTAAKLVQTVHRVCADR